MQSIGVWEIQEHCCLLLGKLLDKVDARPDEEVISILGDHLQVVPRLCEYLGWNLLRCPEIRGLIKTLPFSVDCFKTCFLLCRSWASPA